MSARGEGFQKRCFTARRESTTPRPHGTLPTRRWLVDEALIGPNRPEQPSTRTKASRPLFPVFPSSPLGEINNQMIFKHRPLGFVRKPSVKTLTDLNGRFGGTGSGRPGDDRVKQYSGDVFSKGPRSFRFSNTVYVVPKRFASRNTELSHSPVGLRVRRDSDVRRSGDAAAVRIGVGARRRSGVFFFGPAASARRDLSLLYIAWRPARS